MTTNLRKELMEDDEGTARKRQRRRAVRPAGPVAGAAAAEPETEALSLEKTAPEAAPPEAVTPEAAISESVTLEDDAAEADPAPRRRGVLLTGAFVLVVLALVATGVYLFVENRSVDADNARAERYVQTARQTVLNLTTISPDTAQEDVDRLLAGASGDFKAEFEGREGPFVEVVQQARVDSVGEIIEAGLESSGDDYGDVLVAARAMVQNSDAAEPEPRDFRLRVRVADDGGVMTASRVEFVP
jgi:Mce-associated membrane protein